MPASATALAGKIESRETALKNERDRYFALAFCWADLLIELDGDGKIGYAAGASEPLIGCSAESLVGRPMAEIAADGALDANTATLGRLRRDGRGVGETVALRATSGQPLTMSIAGYERARGGGPMYLALKVASAKEDEFSAQRDPDSGLLDGEVFAEAAARRIQEAAESGEDAALTLIALPEMQALLDRLPEAQGKSLSDAFGKILSDGSIDGATAAEMAPGRYSLVHRTETDVAALQDALSALSSRIDPTGAALEVQSAKIEIDGDLSEADLAHGLLYTLNKYSTAEGEGFTIQSLSRNMSSLVEEAAQHLNAFKTMLRERRFEVGLQPIIDVRSGEIHHFEALARFDGPNSSPVAHIQFAEETGLITQFDLAMAEKAVAWLRDKPRNVDAYRLAVNLSGRSVEQPGFADDLHALLASQVDLHGRLLFEITESARMSDLESANEFIQSLRRCGYAVCLDDFGAGAASFQYLSALEVDVVKLDGSAVRNARRAPKGAAFLSALTSLCQQLGVTVVAEMIDDQEGLKFVRDCGVDQVQGYLFGRPSADIEDFMPLPNANLFKRAE